MPVFLSTETSLYLFHIKLHLEKFRAGGRPVAGGSVGWVGGRAGPGGTLEKFRAGGRPVAGGSVGWVGGRAGGK